MAAHPRTGGEHATLDAVESAVAGSPPHGRGTQLADQLHQRQTRLTPARAGNTHRRPIGAPNRRGSPPHGRGTPTEQGVQGVCRGLTPARAGNTPAPKAGPTPRRAHPRTGGEHHSPATVPVWWSGSPPHGRGTPQQRLLRQADSGLTPARAGNTSSSSSASGESRAHPRTGGEHRGSSPARAASAGSPPHGRGTLRGRAQERVPAGLTPARAGNTSHRFSFTPRVTAHPRTGGEHWLLLAGAKLYSGSPPHGRGTRPGRADLSGVPRLTPARAGNTAALIARRA